MRKAGPSIKKNLHEKIRSVHKEKLAWEKPVCT